MSNFASLHNTHFVKMISLMQVIARMDHASISDLLGDASILDLLAALEENHHLDGQAKAESYKHLCGRF